MSSCYDYVSKYQLIKNELTLLNIKPETTAQTIFMVPLESLPSESYLYR